MNYNPYSLEGKTILITGASSGIGQRTAIECSKLGARCVITGRNVERLQETFNQLEGVGHVQIVADLVNQEDLDTLIESTPVIDGLVNNAGISISKPIAFYKQSDLEKTFQTNTFIPMLLVKGLLKKKKINKGGSVVFMSSIAAYCSHLGNGIYGASKSALMTYMRYCSKELSEKLIRCNSVHPGMVETKLIHDGAVSEEDLKRDLEKYPLKRYGKPEDIAWAVIYLLSNASSWITGTELVIDGGATLI